MSQINRPFRGFSGTFARPELPLTHPEIPLEPPQDVTRRPSWHPTQSAPQVSKSRQTSHTPLPTQAPFSAAGTPASQISSSQQSSSPPRPEPAKRRPSHRIIRSVSNIFHAHHKEKDAPKDAPPHKSVFHKPRDRKAKQPCGEVCKNSSDVVIHHGEVEWSGEEKARLAAELEQLYMHTYTKAERRQFYRDWKAREAAACACACSSSDEDTAPDAPASPPSCVAAPAPATATPLTETAVEEISAQVQATTRSLAEDEEDDDFFPLNHPNSFLKPMISKSATWGSTSTDPASSVFTAEYSRASSRSSYEVGPTDITRSPKQESSSKPAKAPLNSDGVRFHNECYKLRKAGMGGGF